MSYKIVRMNIFAAYVKAKPDTENIRGLMLAAIKDDQWEGSCEHGNEPSGSIKCWEVLE
jgi:hypothetical protein